MTTKKTFPKKKTAISTGVLEAVEATDTIVATPAEKSFKIPPTPKKEGNPFIQSFGGKSEKPIIYQLVKGRKRIPGGHPDRPRYRYPVVYMIKAEDIIYDPIMQVNRKIRYIPGEASIYEDEQKKESKVKSPIIFSEGHITVGHQNPTLKNYLDICNSNRNNPNRMKNYPAVFKLIDKAGDAKTILNKEMKELDAMQLALKMPFSKLVGYAKVLGINTEKSTDEIRYDMKMLAKRAPEDFIIGLDDPKTEVKEIIINAKEYGIIDVQINRVSWQKGSDRVLITHVPVGVNSIEHFSNYCLDGEGELVLAEMKKQIERFNS